MQAALPHLDLLAPGADLASIERMLPQTHRGAAMTNDELLDMARELNGRARALRARHGRSGRRAHVGLPRRPGDRPRRRDAARLDRRRVREGRGHRRRARRHRQRRAEARAHLQRPDPARRGCRAATRCPARATARSSSSSSPTALAARCACWAARRPPTRRASSPSASGSGSPMRRTKRPSCWSRRRARATRKRSSARLRSPATHVLMIASRRKAERLRDVMRMRGIDEAQLARLARPGGPGCRRQDAGRDRAGGDRRRARACCAAVPRWRRNAKFINPVCGMAVSIAHPLHVENYQGVSYYFCCDGCRTTFLARPRKVRGNSSKRGLTLFLFFSCSARHISLPEAVRGRASMNSTWRGAL